MKKGTLSRRDALRGALIGATAMAAIAPVETATAGDELDAALAAYRNVTARYNAAQLMYAGRSDREAYEERTAAHEARSEALGRLLRAVLDLSVDLRA
jgi:hypothetical protein